MNLVVVLVLACAVEYTECLSSFEDILLQCRDDFNSPNDWWYMYKQPHMRGQRHKKAGEGAAFTYVSSEHAHTRLWATSEKSIVRESMLSFTLNPMYRPTYKRHMASLIYTERKSKLKVKGQRKAPKAYLNGALMADVRGGLWVQYTIPRFPDINSTQYHFPRASRRLGQMAVCLTLDHDSLETVTQHLMRTRPEILHHHIPPELREFVPGMRKLADRTDADHHRPDKGHSVIKTRGGVEFEIYSKRDNVSSDMFADFAKEKNVHLYVFSHHRSEATIPRALCRTNYSVRPIKSYGIVSGQRQYMIGHYMDRANWGVARHDAPPVRGGAWSCVASAPLARPPRRAAALLLCTDAYDVWLAFKSLVPHQPARCD